MSESNLQEKFPSSTPSLEEEGFQMYLGQKSRLSGVLKVQGMMRIDGFVEGEIYGSDLIQVGKEGTMEGTVFAKDIVAQGPLRGEIAAQSKVQLLAPATLEGKIESPVFLLEEGVFVNGTVKMEAVTHTVQ